MSACGPAVDELECACCGDVAAIADGGGEFTDGAPLECGCTGWVKVEEGEAAAVFIDPDGCDRCAGWPGGDE